MSGLVVTSMSVGYGRMKVVHDLSLSVSPGEIVALLGRNGAGKTTSVLGIAGLLRDQFEGDISLDGRSIARMKPWELCVQGLAVVQEGRRVFREMTVSENLRLGAYRKRRKLNVDEELEDVLDLFPALRTYAHREVGLLSGGQQQMVAIGQALIGRPSYMLLDEPCAGLAPTLAHEVYAVVQKLRTRGCGVLVIEQDIERIHGLVDRLYLLEQGSILLERAAQDFDIAEIETVIMGNDFT